MDLYECILLIFIVHILYVINKIVYCRTTYDTSIKSALMILFIIPSDDEQEDDDDDSSDPEPDSKKLKSR